MGFDPKVPEELKTIQEWFSEIITMLIDEKSHMSPVSPKGRPMEEEAKDYIVPSPTMEPKARIELYNQQYWWRLLNTLQRTFPLVTRLLGYRNFNEQIAEPYLQKHPSHHWSLSFLGERLPQWLQEEYQGEDKDVLLDAVEIDWAYNIAFFAAHYPPITDQLTDPAEAMVRKAFLQPHIHLFKLDSDLFRFRLEMKEKDPDFWSNHHYATLRHALAEGESHFPELKRDKTYYFVLYRNSLNRVAYQDITEAEYFFLRQFQKGAAIEEAIDTLDVSYLPEAQEYLQSWVQKWIANQWLR